MLARDESRGHPMGFNPWIFTIEKRCPTVLKNVF